MLRHMARSSSGLGRRPLKAEITSSNLVRATMNCKAGCFGGLPFLLRRPVPGPSRRRPSRRLHVVLVTAASLTVHVHMQTAGRRRRTAARAGFRREGRRASGKGYKVAPDSDYLCLAAALGTTFCVGSIGL